VLRETVPFGRSAQAPYQMHNKINHAASPLHKQTHTHTHTWGQRLLDHTFPLRGGLSDKLGTREDESG